MPLGYGGTYSTRGGRISSDSRPKELLQEDQEIRRF
jgi:hypothetical protein